MRRLTFGSFLLAGLMLASTVFAHAKLLSSTPADAAQLAESPTTLTLTFAEAVKLAAIELGAPGHSVPVPVDHSAKATPIVVLPLPPLAPGHYEVRWSAISPGDGHVSKGSLTFTVQPAKH